LLVWSLVLRILGSAQKLGRGLGFLPKTEAEPRRNFGLFQLIDPCSSFPAYVVLAAQLCYIYSVRKLTCEDAVCDHVLFLFQILMMHTVKKNTFKNILMMLFSPKAS